jgi:hypothetical protein
MTGPSSADSKVCAAVATDEAKLERIAADSGGYLTAQAWLSGGKASRLHLVANAPGHDPVTLCGRTPGSATASPAGACRICLLTHQAGARALSPEQLRAIYRDHIEGRASITQSAKRLRISLDALRRLLYQQGLREPGDDTERKRTRARARRRAVRRRRRAPDHADCPPELLELNNAYWEQSLTLGEAGQRIGASVKRMHRLFAQHGLPIRSRREAQSATQRLRRRSLTALAAAQGRHDAAKEMSEAAYERLRAESAADWPTAPQARRAIVKTGAWRAAVQLAAARARANHTAPANPIPRGA